MRKVILFIALSLDGYIADRNGGVDWLSGQEPGKDIWVCGGASIAARLMDADLIDEYHLSFIPCLLGGGIRLFSENETGKLLRLEETFSENGILNCVYTRR